MTDQADYADAYNLLARAALTQLLTVARDNNLDSHLLVKRTASHIQRHLEHARKVQRERQESMGVFV